MIVVRKDVDVRVRESECDDRIMANPAFFLCFALHSDDGCTVGALYTEANRWL